jgi:ABC-type antimicrobial peptide transport system permease subunit
MEDATGSSLYAERVAASLLSVVGLVCLTLAAIGLYRVMSYAVGQRTHELGVRMALGANPKDVLALLMKEGLRLTLLGSGDIRRGGRVPGTGSRDRQLSA